MFAEYKLGTTKLDGALINPSRIIKARKTYRAGVCTEKWTRLYGLLKRNGSSWPISDL